MGIKDSQITEMRTHLEGCAKYLDALEQSFQTPTKINSLLDAAMENIELACLDMRRLSETMRPKIPESTPGNTSNYHTKMIYGEVFLTETGWVHIKLNTLLPHYKILGGTQYLSDCITRLLNKFETEGGKLPLYPKAYLAIIEYCSARSCEVFDHDNKGYKAVLNALKGRLFQDDDQFELSLGLFSVQDNRPPCCHIHVMPEDAASEFHYLKANEML